MGMAVRFAAIPLCVMRMPVMLVVHVFVRVRRRLMHMFVLVPLGEVQPHAKPHQSRCRPERRARALVEKEERERCAVEGRD